MPSTNAPTNHAANPNSSVVDAVIVGAGFAGLYMLHRLREQGLKAIIIEAGSGPGGTWFWNRYPGARVDIESMQYSYQFSAELQQEWQWSERYAPQAELLKYINHVVERFELARDIQFNTRVQSALFDQDNKSWRVTTDRGQKMEARFCIMATGCLSAANRPDIAGADDFAGPTYHTGEWPHEAVDFSGKRVGIIGTGSSAIQAIPIIAAEAAHLAVFQRTPNFSVPAHNKPLKPDYVAAVKKNYDSVREQGKQEFCAFDTQANDKAGTEMSPEQIKVELNKRWALGGLNFYGGFSDFLTDKGTNDLIADFVREKIAEKVTDPKIAALLAPKTVFACKRLCADTGYFETYNRNNVTLVDIASTPIETITPDGLRMGKDDEEQNHSFDILVFATGFDAMTGSLNKIDIRGIDGHSLKEKWAAGPRTYLGLCSAGFPNLFTISGPGSPSVFTNMVTSIEQHVEYISDIITYIDKNHLATIDASEAAEDQWVAHVNEVASATLVNACSSWYLGANVPGKERVFMPYVGGFPVYVEKCDDVAANNYQGFVFA
ncbi:MAG: NAD(P)/FAD-dependent oxidoreductase [Gammaproteobacteria bacterium]|nr:NAD(P)/FAD-dependent oxidoreductase [Gammaproteobacteria bacterium]MBQ0840730.1 NAD(P)/FAD-dependent oxidoreductase [Gammaproteobacteria bacterium]